LLLLQAGGLCLPQIASAASAAKFFPPGLRLLIIDNRPPFVQDATGTKAGQSGTKAGQKRKKFSRQIACQNYN
jgi:hypothetical protein